MSVTNEELFYRLLAQSDETDEIGTTAKSSIGKTEAQKIVKKHVIKDTGVTRQAPKKNSVETATPKGKKSGFDMLSLPDKALYLALYPIAHLIGFSRRMGKKAQKTRLHKSLQKAIGNVKRNVVSLCGNKIAAKPLVHHALIHHRYVPKLLTVALAVGILYLAVLNIPTEATLIAYVDGQKIGAVESVKAVELAMLSAEQEVASKNGYDYKLSCEVTYDIAELNKPQFVSNQLLQDTFETVTQKELTEAVGLYIDGNLVAVSSSKTALENSLQESLALFEKSEKKTKKEPEDEEYGFANKIEYSVKQYPKGSIMDEAQIRSLLGLPKKAGAEHPHVNADAVKVSEPQKVLPALKLSAAGTHTTSTASNDAMHTAANGTAGTSQSAKTGSAATLNYSVIKEETVRETLPAQTVYQNTDNLFVGKTAIKQKGVDGLADSKYKVEYVEGAEVGRTMIDQIIVKEAIPTLVLVGTHEPTKEELAVMPTGTYILPYKGKLSSGYGWRKDLGYREFHPAWDITGPSGCSVIAIDGGTVIFTGYEAGYGNYLLVDHGDGVISLYAHLKSFSVKKGAKVGQGYEIGKMGRTGRATGVHVHLEIRKNNVAQNPQNFLTKPPAQ